MLQTLINRRVASIAHTTLNAAEVDVDVKKQGEFLAWLSDKFPEEYRMARIRLFALSEPSYKLVHNNDVRDNATPMMWD